MDEEEQKDKLEAQDDLILFEPRRLHDGHD